MASELKSYVEKFLLNPAASFNVDDEGNEETTAQIVESLAEDEGVNNNQQSRSKLRARNEARTLETDPRYRGKKVSRKDLKEEISFDPELTKYFTADSDEDDAGSEDEEEIASPSENEDGEEVDDSEDNKQEEDESSESDEGDGLDDGQNVETEDGLVFDGDFNKFAEDIEEDDDDDDDELESEEDRDDNESGVEDEVMETEEKAEKASRVTIKRFQSSDETEELQKSQCVKKQLALFDSLFELRIGMQKCIAGANQLPQCNTYKAFLQEKDPNYMKNLASAKSATKKLLSTLLEAQMIILNQNPETSRLLSENKKSMKGQRDEEITSSEDELEKATEEEPHPRGTKRKIKLEEYGEVLSKRHAALEPFRDETLTRWYEKTKLLSSNRNRGHNKFAGFEVSALQQLHNVLNNKPQLIRRTQLTGVTRGTAYHILGQKDENVADADKEEYNVEIFDDYDFYSRALEEMLKSKISVSDDMTNVSRKWIEIQKLRKKAKRKVDTKASKGRKLRYEVISKMQQYLAPCCPSQMDDAAINTLFASLFGKGMHMDKSVRV